MLINDSIEAFRYIQRQQGWIPAFKQTAQFLREPFFEHHNGFVLRMSLTEPIDVPQPGVSVKICQAGLDDLALLETIVPPLRVKRLAKKFQAGEMCFIAIKEEKVVAYVFAGFAGTPSTRESQLELGPQEAYLWAGYALPQYRRQGVVGSVNLSLCSLLKEMGYESVILLVERQNKASLGHCYKMGYRLTDQISYLRVLGWGKPQILPLEDDP